MEIKNREDLIHYLTGTWFCNKAESVDEKKLLKLKFDFSQQDKDLCIITWEDNGNEKNEEFDFNNGFFKTRDESYPFTNSKKPYFFHPIDNENLQFGEFVSQSLEVVKWRRMFKKI